MPQRRLPRERGVPGRRAIGLIDFDFAAPGRPLYDLVQLARMCVPLDDDVTAARLGWAPADRAGRLRLVCDEYGLGAVARRDVLGLLSESFDLAAEFVRRRVEAGDAAYAERLDRSGGPQRFEARHRWWSSRREEFARALR